MKWRYNLRLRPGKIVDTIYPDMKDREFTTAEVAAAIGKQCSGTGAILGSLASTGALTRANGERRSHYSGRNGPTRWRFTPDFKKWYETTYSSEG